MTWETTTWLWQKFIVVRRPYSMTWSPGTPPSGLSNARSPHFPSSKTPCQFFHKTSETCWQLAGEIQPKKEGSLQSFWVELRCISPKCSSSPIAPKTYPSCVWKLDEKTPVMAVLNWNCDWPVDGMGLSGCPPKKIDKLTYVWLLILLIYCLSKWYSLALSSHKMLVDINPVPWSGGSVSW